MMLEGKAALVTGASRGIGKAIAITLAKAGASVACASTSAGGCDATVAEAGGNAFSLVCDVSDPLQAESAAAATIDRFGSLDILVNNAGLARDQLILRMSHEDWDRVIAVNLTGAYNCIKAAARPMMKARWGRIINITSIVGLSGQAGQANYAAAKAGLIGLTKSVAKEFGSRGITCNAIAPGFIETDMTADLSQEMREHVQKTAPAGRLGNGEDIASAVAFLAGDGASYITGQVLVVDGGLSL
jgi:3-oxoacyl-[acyl-carrier protein] reductase